MLSTPFNVTLTPTPMRSTPALPPLLLVLFVVLGGLSARPGDGAAQTVSVRLQVTERTEGLFARRFEGALRSLEEVRLAERGEAPDYALNVSVLCVPRADQCEGAESFAVSIVLAEPLGAGALKSGLSLVGDEGLEEWTPIPESPLFLARYRRLHALWTTWWGSDRYGDEVDRLVRSIDVRCFEKRRILRKMAEVRGREGEEGAMDEDLLDPYDEDDWLC